MSLGNWISGRVFQFVHGNNLVYNTCWEDPRLDRQALELSPQDRVLVITSAGCNALDYAFVGPQHVYAVDMNPRQNALLELKMEGIRKLDFQDFFQLFGEGYHQQVSKIYRQTLRPGLSDWAASYWDKCINFFDNSKRTFYYRGTSGTFARGISFYIDRVAKIRPEVTELLACATVEEQQQVFGRIRDRFWSRTMKFTLKRDATLSMLGCQRLSGCRLTSSIQAGFLASSKIPWRQFLPNCQFMKTTSGGFTSPAATRRMLP